MEAKLREIEQKVDDSGKSLGPCTVGSTHVFPSIVLTPLLRFRSLLWQGGCSQLLCFQPKKFVL
jgi:hypothetical protein